MIVILDKDTIFEIEEKKIITQFVDITVRFEQPKHINCRCSTTYKEVK